MPSITLTPRAIAGERAFAVWSDVDGPVVVQITAEQYNAGEFGQPTPTATFRMAARTDALDVPEGRGTVGDAWVNSSGTLSVRVGNGDDFTYESRLPDGTRKRVSATGNVVQLHRDSWSGSIETANLRVAMLGLKLRGGVLDVDALPTEPMEVNDVVDV